MDPVNNTNSHVGWEMSVKGNMDYQKPATLKEESFDDCTCNRNVNSKMKLEPVVALLRLKDEEIQESKKLIDLTDSIKTETCSPIKLNKKEDDNKENIQVQLKAEGCKKFEIKNDMLTIKDEDIPCVTEYIRDSTEYVIEGELSNQPGTTRKRKKKSGEMEVRNLSGGLETVNSVIDNIMKGEEKNIYNKRQRNSNENKKINNSFICAVCDKIFSCKFFLQKHIESVHNKERKKCSICYKFFSVHSLKRHMQSHENRPMYECSICERTFISRTGIQRHLNLHNNILHKCSLCNKTFYNKQNLKCHEISHHGTTTEHVCSVCKKCFVSKIKLDYHMLSHKGKRMYECSICSKTYILKAHINQHLMTHDNEKKFVCHLCGRRFPFLFYLNGHMRDSHNQERNLKCSVCGSCFTRKYHLKRHIKSIHSKIKEFQCSICHMRFPEKYRRDAHVKKVHMTRKVRRRKSLVL